SGAMAIGWQKIGNQWYYLKGNGAMATGWQWINGKCYYLNASGQMAVNTTIGGYKVGANGAWIY
ncbi:MAG: N-acetylmuramoyl-L-alanine amidase family protein, partial [Oscillospiraceae bacterium]